MLPQEFTIGLADPQSEISVWFHGAGEPLEVTGRHTIACTAPLVLCVAFDGRQGRSASSFREPLLRFCARDGMHVLGEIRLTFQSTLSAGGSEFVLFLAAGSSNYCLPKIRLWAHFALHAYRQWTRTDTADVRMSLRDFRASLVAFIRPHPLYLGSIGDASRGNIFPMNLLGDLGNGCVGFALREMRVPAHRIAESGRLALSGMPLSHAALPFRLAVNHTKEAVDWGELPFETEPSRVFGIPVPVLATQVRELQVEEYRPLGSHRLFIARTISDETKSSEVQVCVVHGFYQCWRLRGERELLQASIAEDLRNKGRR